MSAIKKIFPIILLTILLSSFNQNLSVINKLQGLWRNIEDSTECVEINKNEWTFIYTDGKKVDLAIYKMMVKDTIIHTYSKQKFAYLLLLNDNDSLEYDISNLNDSLLYLSTVETQHGHNYQRVRKK